MYGISASGYPSTYTAKSSPPILCPYSLLNTLLTLTKYTHGTSQPTPETDVKYTVAICKFRNRIHKQICESPTIAAATSYPCPPQ